MANEIFTRKEAASIFRVKPKTITKWLSAGLIVPTVRINGRPLFSVEDLERVAERKSIATTPKAQTND